MASLHQPSPRFYHSAVQVQEKSFVWGGRIENFSDTSRRVLKVAINIFNPYLETWEKRMTTGIPPPGLYEGASIWLLDGLYSFGGRDRKKFYNSIHKLHTGTLEWNEAVAHNPAEGPTPKIGSGMVAYKDQLALIAGYGGTPTGPLQSGTQFIKSYKFKEYGWTNEFHLFNVTEGSWSSPPTTGPRPPPCAGFSFTAISKSQAVMFGGYQPGRGRVNDVYIIDFESLEWTRLERRKGVPWPGERDAHAACCLNYGEKHIQLLVTGGVGKSRRTLSDVWILDVYSGSWRELTLPEGTQPRFGHTTTASTLCPGVVHVTMFGGCPKFVFGDDAKKKLANTTVMEFKSFESLPSGETSSCRQWVLVGVVDSSQLGMPERTRELEKLKQRKTEHAGPDEVKFKDQQIQTEIIETEDQHIQTGSLTKQNEVEVMDKQIQTEITETLPQHVQARSMTEQQDYLRGVEVIDHTSFIYNGRARSFNWRGYGFMMHFPENALPSGAEKCEVHVKASLAGQFQFPQGMELVSGVYWISTPNKFAKPVTVEIQHCSARVEHLSSLTYIVTKCTQEDLPYNFKILNGGVFSSSSRYGSIRLTQFSAFAITSLLRLSSLIQWPRIKCYCARLYYCKSGNHSWEVYFAIVWDLELHIAAVDAKYTEAAARVGPDQEVMFEGENITLDIPKEGLVLASGWTITPHTYPGITKRQVDQFVPGRRVPSCQLNVKWTGQHDQPVELMHRVQLLGAKEPFNFFLIQPPLPPQSPQGAIPNEEITTQMAGYEETKPLGTENLADITVYLHPLGRTAVFNLGLVLGLDYNRLRPLIDSSNFLADMLAGWLQRVDQVQRAGVPTWKRLVEALRDPRVGQNGIASNIEQHEQ